ncbi:MAG: phosphoserine phosphatase SerB [Rhodospirillaceae bacterium]|jgi:phosphoserine phosphatase|nr:phosphoserine phosphatase SerB [Rhodospirillaceae bacterium]MBT4218665.1 phosphoserine phosphatase SerB [Rhodospirillaceae bacterium]MBT5014356.1 phosphoserine phosphatase SerB [Rhodospirillaceae bacterium]MBT5308661.1 phosphoserine phosphatase SerB [Rhodospirillaceae bacterium]MBT7357131.1 phosphoserine phosphatase SerB [Rhodospirillaceae bacterium]
MDSVLTLICDPLNPDLDSSIVSEAAAALNAQGGETGTPDWLSDGVACDIVFGGISLSDACAAVDLHLQGFPVDIAAQTLDGRRKKLLVADMDSTIVTSETLDELADYAGHGEDVVKITARAMNGEVGFADALRERVALLEGLEADALEKTMARVNMTSGAETLVGTMAANGAKALLVSGGFTYFTERVRDMAGFARDMGNTLEIEGGKLTGRVIEPIVNNVVKLQALQDFATDNGVGVGDVLAVGDGANDLDMLQAAGTGVAYHAKPVVSARARIRIEHADLTALLYLQGYRKSDFIVPA